MSPLQSVRILELFCERICYLRYSLRTEEAHVYWPISFIRCHSLRHPGEMGKVDRGVPDGVGEQAQCLIVYASTHRQTWPSLLFLYSKVLGVELLWMEEIGRPRKMKRLAVTLAADEAVRIFHQMDNEFLLIAQLLDGIEQRILEAMRLRGLRCDVCVAIGNF